MTRNETKFIFAMAESPVVGSDISLSSPKKAVKSERLHACEQCIKAFKRRSHLTRYHDYVRLFLSFRIDDRGTYGTCMTSYACHFYDNTCGLMDINMSRRHWLTNLAAFKQAHAYTSRAQTILVQSVQRNVRPQRRSQSTSPEPFRCSYYEYY